MTRIEEIKTILGDHMSSDMRDYLLREIEADKKQAIVAALDSVQSAVDDSVNLKDKIECDWTEEAYNRVTDIIEAVKGGSK